VKVLASLLDDACPVFAQAIEQSTAGTLDGGNMDIETLKKILDEIRNSEEYSSCDGKYCSN
jgi:hypothetical protein